MAWYKSDWAVKHSESSAYNKGYDPGLPAPHAGIYRCDGCGREIAIAQGDHLPRRDHHEHTAADGAVLWQLTVYADHRPADQQV